MTSTSSQSFLRYFESYARGGLDERNMTPKEFGDFRERVPRESVRGRYMFFHETMEQYLYRHWRAYTVPRAAAWWIISYSFLLNGTTMFLKTFNNLESYKSFSSHPSYKLLGGFWSYFYAIRPIFWAWVTFKMTRFTYQMTLRHLDGKDD